MLRNIILLEMLLAYPLLYKLGARVHATPSRTKKDSNREETENMKHSLKTGILSAFTAGVIALGVSFTPAPAHALSLKLSSISSGTVSGPVTCPSGTPGCFPAGPTTGGVLFTSLVGGSIGVFNITQASGQGPTTLGTFASPSLDLSVLVASSSAGTLTIALSEVGFTGNLPSSVSGFSGALSATQLLAGGQSSST